MDAPKALIEAVDTGDVDRVRSVLEQDPAMASTRKDGVSLLLVARYQNNLPMTQLLRSPGRPLDIFEAAAFDDAGRIGELIAADRALARAWSADGFTPLHLAAFFGGVDGARLLLDAGADMNFESRNDFHVRPIYSAAAGRESVARLLVQRGAELNVRQRHGWTPLHSAANNGFAALVDEMLAAGADPNATNDDGVLAI